MVHGLGRWYGPSSGRIRSKLGEDQVQVKDVVTPPSCEKITDTCENITFPCTTYVVGKNYSDYFQYNILTI